MASSVKKLRGITIPPWTDKQWISQLDRFIAIDRTSKSAIAQLVEKANTVTARGFFDALVVAVPYRIEIILTDNCIRIRRPAQRPFGAHSHVARASV